MAGMPVSEPLIEDRSSSAASVWRIRASISMALPAMDLCRAWTFTLLSPSWRMARWAPSAAPWMLTSDCRNGHEQQEWALGMKMVVELREDSGLEAGDGSAHHRISGAGRFLDFCTCIPIGWRLSASSFLRGSAARCARPIAICSTSCFILIYGDHLQGGTLKSWGAKSLQESGRHGEPFLAGNGYARIGEGSGSTNVLAGSGVDEAWTTGVQLAEAVIELLEAEEAIYERKSRADLCSPPPGKLGGFGSEDRRRFAQWLSAREWLAA